MRTTRPLLDWDGTPGFLCDWHIGGLFDAGLQHNPDPILFDKKISRRWDEDHLAPWGGATRIAGVPSPGATVDWDWPLLPLSSIRNSRCCARERTFRRGRSA